jgi:hypothetical protein
MDRDTLLAEIRDTHEELEVALDGLTDDALLEPAVGIDGWTRKDVLAHLAWWTDHSARVIEALLAGRDPYDRSGPWDIDAHNARVYEEHRDRPAGEVRRWEGETYRQVVAAVGQASDEDLFTAGRFEWLGSGTLAETVRADTSEHYREHLSALAPAGG